MPRRNNSRSRRPAAPQPQSNVRIIGGEWRGRKLDFPAIEGLRPTPDRVRETLFNWLQAYVPGARCLDLFCGSGALGLEALSRGAASVTFVDQAPEVVRQLRSNLNSLKAQNAELIGNSVPTWLEQRSTNEEVRYDLVFMDPPFRKGLAAPVCALLEQHQLLADEALIYVETEVELQLEQLPHNWQLYREKQAGQVAYRLFMRQPGQQDID
ncbi:16S rRNA (guanine(966)-N(2))-methyltransferase RsmD [Marinobacterium sediminicola]|uniref:Ribosomal RNA small subunit methyltransferase D n=1 Tax=Marinobacterium sediminicola TaxID=518898 RepID=A0ABY1RZ24_9GAMM|nr:16S rRNA (guanine(966)-N(2))-methyltransferase RsmD [Marinobacterium sediminicola]ULG69159.1 16S rRNA (guanine(966)-N(2))-methyltransferase RsmD [Marinobacterium sediminicola]SMR73559.1 16S rRNA m(2)G-966 methyltransferase [Marinobacterium sediminicola]